MQTNVGIGSICGSRRRLTGGGLAAAAALVAVIGLTPGAASAATLPDGRAYEMVSPADTNGGEVALSPTEPNAYNPVVSATGTGILWGSPGIFGDPLTGASPNLFPYVSTRGSDDWSTSSVQPPAAAKFPSTQFGDGYLELNSSDLTKQVFEVPPSQTAGDGTVGELDLCDGPTACTNMTASFPVEDTDTAPGPNYIGAIAPLAVGATADLSHVVFDITTGTTLSSRAVEVYDWTGGKPVQVSVNPDGTSPAAAAAGDGIDEALHPLPAGTVSADGSHIFFTTLSSGAAQTINGGNSTAVSGEVMVRIDGDRTIDIGAGMFGGASASGQTAAVISNTALTGGAAAGTNLYLWNQNASTPVTLVTPDSVDSTGAGVLGVVAVSPDGSHVYYIATGKIDGTSAPDDATPKLYDYTGGNSTYVGAVNCADTAGLTLNMALTIGSCTGTSNAGRAHTADVSADGRVLLFQSVANVTGYDADGHSEIYRYDASTNTVQCVSCDPSGAVATGDAELTPLANPGVTTNIVNTNEQVSNLSPDGGRVFFDSADPLVPQASNSGIEDTYEWETDGTGSCTNASQSGGCLYLISDGTSSYPSSFAGMSADGTDAYFTSVDPLVPQAPDDGSVRLYDARVGGGLPQAATVACAGSSTCQGTPNRAPSTPSAGTGSFNGPGNPGAPPSVTDAAAKISAVRALTVKLSKTNTFALKVKVTAKGQLTVTGSGIKRLVSKSTKAETVRLVVHLTKAEAQRLREDQTALVKQNAKRRGKPKRKRAVAKLRLHAKVAYRPASGRSSSVTVTVTVKA